MLSRLFGSYLSCVPRMTASRWFSRVSILTLFDPDSIRERVGLITYYIEYKVAPDDGVRIDEVSE